MKAVYIKDLLLRTCMVLLWFGVSEKGWGQQVIGSYPDMNGGFEGATIDNTVFSSAQSGKWVKNNASQTIGYESTTVRSGSTSLSATNTTTTGRRIWSPLVTVSSFTSSVTIQYYRRVSNITNTQESQSGIGNGTTTSENLSGTYTVPSAANTWEKVTYTRSSTAYTDIAGVVMTKQIGTGGTMFIDDLVMYNGSVDNTAPNSSGTVTVANSTTSSLDISWGAASGGVDGGGYIVVRYSSIPNADNDPNQNGIYAVGNTTTNGTGSLTGTIRYIGTVTSFTDNVGLASGTQYWYKVYTVDKAFNFSVESSGNGTTSSATPSITLASTNPAVAASDLIPSATKQPVYKFTTAVTTANATLNSVAFTTTNTSASDITKYQLWYNSSDNLGTASQIGSNITSSLGSGSRTFSSLTQSISSGATGYFWITVDVASAPTAGNTLSVSAITTSDLTFASGTKSGTASAGGTQTFINTPGAPTIGTITAGNQQLSCAFTAGTTGGSSITNYEYSTNGGTNWTTRSPAATSTPIVITGLTNGSTYDVKIRAVNAAGSGTASSTVQGTPRTTPGAPNINTITPGNQQLQVAFTAPASNGGSSITDYEYSTDNGSSFKSSGVTSSPYTITTESGSSSALANGTQYSIIFRAVNAAGAGASSTMVTGTPAAGCTAPSTQASGFGTSSVTDVTATVTWTRGNGDNVLVLMKSGSAVNSSPSSGTSYSANASFGSGSQIGTGNYVVYAGTGTSVAVTGLTTGITYHVAIIEYNNTGTCYSSSPLTGNFTTKSLPAVSTSAASGVSVTTATLNGNVTNDGGYSVSRGFVYSSINTNPTVGGANVTDVSVGTGTGTYTNGPTLSQNTTYYYQAYATNSLGTSYGGVQNFTTLKPEPTAHVTSFAIGTVTTSNIPLTWTAASPTPDGYLLLVNSSSVTDPTDGTAVSDDLDVSNGTGAINLSGSASSYSSFTGFAAGTTYTFKIYPYNNSGSNIDYLVTSAPSVNSLLLPAAPTTPTFSLVTQSSFTITWGSVTGASSYRLDLSDNSGFSSYISGYQDLTVNSTSQAVSGLSANTTYYTRVRAVNSAGTGANASANQTTLCTPTDVTSLAGTNGNTQSAVTFALPACYDEVLVVAKPTSSVAASPSGDGSAYTASATFGSGTSFDGTGRVVYKGTGTSVTITGLTNGTTYYIKAFTREGSQWSSGTEVSVVPDLPTYTWTGSSGGSLATSTNWSPNRATLSSSDVLIFNTNSTLTITGVSTQTIGKLEVRGSSTKITLQASASTQVLTIGNVTGTDLIVDAGCELNISGSTILSLVTASGATGSINGSMKFTNAAHTLVPNDANAVTFNNGATFTAGDLVSTGFSGNAFGPTSTTAPNNGVVFASGATYTQFEGSNPFAMTQPNSRVQFQSGSNFIYSLAGSSVPSLSGRTYGNLEINATSTGFTNMTGNSALIINGNLIITSAGSAVNFNLTGGISIAGNISVASGQTLGFSPTSASTLTLNGTSLQTISGSGTLTLGSNTSLTINNSAGVTLSRSLTLANTLTLTSGTLTVGANTLTLNGSISRTSGNIDASNASATAVFSGSSAQSIPASAFTGNINNLTLNNSAGLSSSQSLTIANALTLTAGTFTVGSNTLTLNGSISRTSGNIDASNASATSVFSGSSAQIIPAAVFTGNINNLTLNNSAGLSSSQSLTIANDLTLTAGTFTVGSNTLTLNGSINRTTGNIDASNSSATVVFNGNSAQSIPTSTFTGNVAKLTLSNSNGLTVNQSITVSAILTLTSGILDLSSQTLTISGTVARTSGTIDADAGTLTFTNTIGRTLPSSLFSGNINNLTMNGSGGITLGNAATVTGTLTLTSGLLTTTSTNLLTLADGSTVSGVSNSSFIHGPIKKVGNTGFTFPVGASGTGYQPIQIANFSGTTASTDAFTAEYKRSSASGVGTNINSPVNRVSYCEYWQLDRTNGTPAVDVTLHFNTNSGCGGGTPADYLVGNSGLLSELRVCRWDGTQWVNYTTSYTGTAPNVTLTATGVSSFSPFTVGSTGLAPLPLKLLSFKGIKSNESVHLNWVTLDETHMKSVILHSSTDGVNFEKVAEISARNTPLNIYAFIDTSVAMRKTYRMQQNRYYRLEFIENDLSSEFSPWINVIDSEVAEHPTQFFDLYPNPANNQGITLFSRLTGNVSAELNLFDNTGRLVYRQNSNFDKRISLPTSMLRPGMYTLLIQLPDGRLERHKICKQP